MAEMKKVPAIRFKRFSDEWVNSKLGEVAEIKSGSTPLRSNPIFYENGNIPWVKTTDLNNSFITYTEEKITTHAKARVNPANSVLVAMYGGFNQIGRTGLLTVPAATNQALSVLNTNENEVLALYLLTWLNAKVDFWKMLAGSSRKDPNITGSDVSAFPISFPNAKEQTQIGSYFQHLDRLISLHQTKVNKLTNLKKAMLEKMFPKPGADVPEIRFKGFVGAWNEDDLGQLAKITTGSSNRVDSGLDGEFTFFDRSDDIRTSNIYLFDCEAVIVAGEGSDFVPKYFVGKFDLHQRTYAIMNFDKLDGKFLYYYIYLFRKHFLDYAVGSTVKSLRLPMFKEMPIKYPNEVEQEKVGSYFFNLDKTITLHQTELEKLTNLKKAFLEKMFV